MNNAALYALISNLAILIRWPDTNPTTITTVIVNYCNGVDLPTHWEGLALSDTQLQLLENLKQLHNPPQGMVRMVCTNTLNWGN